MEIQVLRTNLSQKTLYPNLNILLHPKIEIMCSIADLLKAVLSPNVTPRSALLIE